MIIEKWAKSKLYSSIEQQSTIKPKIMFETKLNSILVGGTLAEEKGEILYLEHPSKFGWVHERIQGFGCGCWWNNSSDKTRFTNESCYSDLWLTIKMKVWRQLAL